MVANAQRQVMGWSLHHPGFDKRAGAGRKTRPGVGIARGRDGPGVGAAFTDNKLKFAVALLGNAKQRNRAFFDFKLYGCAVPGLAMKAGEAS